MTPQTEKSSSTLKVQQWLILIVPTIVSIALWFSWLFWGVDATLRYVAEKVPTKEKPAAAVKPKPAAPATNSTEVLATETEAELLSKRMAMLGQIGDLFGGINALFGALACAGVFWAGYLQRQALIEAQVAFRREREANLEDRKAMAKQQFEVTFFQLLALAREVAASIEIRDGDRQGAKALESLAKGIDSRVPEHENTSDTTKLLGKLAILYEEQVFGQHPSAVGPYFRALYQTFKLVDDSSIDIVPANDKIKYANIARGQISEGAVLLLAINGLAPRGDKFAPLIETYGLLEHMHPRYRQRFQKALELFYAASSFMGSTERQSARLLHDASLRQNLRAKLDQQFNIWNKQAKP